MDKDNAEKLPPEGADRPSETVEDTAQSGLVPIIEVWPDDADSSSSSSRRRQTTSPGSRIRLVGDIEKFVGNTWSSRTLTVVCRSPCGFWAPILG